MPARLLQATRQNLKVRCEAEDPFGVLTEFHSVVACQSGASCLLKLMAQKAEYEMVGGATSRRRAIGSAAVQGPGLVTPGQLSRRRGCQAAAACAWLCACPAPAPCRVTDEQP